MNESLSIFFHNIYDIAFLFQSLCISFATALVLHPLTKRDWKHALVWFLYWVIAFGLVFVFELIFFLFGSAARYGLGLFFSLGYLGAIACFALCFSKTAWKEIFLDRKIVL